MPSAGEFLALLTAGDRQDLEAIARRQEAGRGDVLLARGEVADRVLVVESGRVKIAVTTATGREVVLTFRGPGALLGDQALVVEVAAFRPRTFEAKEPMLLNELLQGIAQRMIAGRRREPTAE